MWIKYPYKSVCVAFIIHRQLYCKNLFHLQFCSCKHMNEQWVALGDKALHMTKPVSLESDRFLKVLLLGCSSATEHFKAHLHTVLIHCNDHN